MKLRSLMKKALSVLLCAFVLVFAAGCELDSITGSDKTTSVGNNDGGSQRTSRAYLPVKKEGGGKFCIAYVDIDPYNPTFRQIYFAIEALRDIGWISYESLPFDPETDADSLALMNWLADNAQSDYLEFTRESNYYTSVSTEEEIYESLKPQVESGKIDIILAMATSVSAMVQRFNFDVPLLMYGVSDAVGSGLVASAEDSGNDNYWAHIDSSAYERQLQYYYDTVGFKNVGVIYEDEVIASIDDYRNAAKKNGFTLTEYVLIRDVPDEDYYRVYGEYIDKMINEDKVDAFVITSNSITDIEMAKQLMQRFIDNNIPVFAQIDAAMVQEGAALLIVDPRDATETGPFVANIIGSVLNGSKPRELEQEYGSAPFLTLNLDVADKIGFKPSFEMLIACEKVICSE